ncbi:DEAD/DEAH box helicase [Candidatus Woesearchaeota archaeon]|jgi:ERCC4-related helicase|nr:DEAD/DEAH box helicase [Candidatus Woesearchaeota archaeon]MBT4630990.1 DEAD/DEAH box helicase [Candidatus Woesearchaeota archaeon]
MKINFQPRLYQETILDSCIKDNTLVVLPTGMGKTKIGILAAINRLKGYPDSKILFLTPTKPLANQIYNEFKQETNIKEINLFTGTVQPKKRAELWKQSKIIISTPQTIENDIINNSINYSEVSLLIFDEAHRAQKDYSYTWIAKQYHKNSKVERIIGLTASPGSDNETISEIIKNLYIKNIEVRTDQDPDVKQYIQEIDIDWIKVNLPNELKEIKKFLDDALKSKLKSLSELGYLRTKNISKKELLRIQASIQGRIATGEKDFQMFRAISVCAEAIKVNHAIEMLETQGVSSLNKYLDSIFKDTKVQTKAVKNLIIDLNVKSAYIKAKNSKIQHPKLIKLKEIVNKEISKNKNSKIIIFNQYRDSAQELEKELNKNKDINAKLFVGQAKKNGTGLTQKEQIKILKDFESSIYNCIISTSIGEEGLDIPKVDMVIFYEPIPSAIRTIQRRGRTARHKEGKVIVLMTKNTRDEVYHWVSVNKEKRMHRLLKGLKHNIIPKKEKTLNDYIKEKENFKVVIDVREKGSNLSKKLVDIGMDVKVKTLVSADIIVSDTVGIERKTIPDFVNSIIDKRIFTQLKDLKNNFENPIIILEGEEDLYSVRNIHPNAIRGMLATIVSSFKIPLLRTKDSQDTAELINAIAKREQIKGEKDIQIRTDKIPMNTKEQQEFIVESFPSIGPSLAKALLRKFKTVKKIINAPKKELEKIEKIGPKKSKNIQDILDEVYPED